MTLAPLPRPLGDGLILRRSTAADAEKLAEFNSRMHSERGWDSPDDRLHAWTTDLLTRPHPTFGTGDFLLVEEQATGRLVSSLNHISQVWSYCGIPFKVGRPELVGTIPEYRHRRLIQAQFEEIHRWSLERGEQVQGITGIPHYYKRFDYEMGLELSGGRVTYAPIVPGLKAEETEPYQVRPATEEDIPFLSLVYNYACARQQISTVFNNALWQYELSGRSERNIIRREVHIIQTASGDPVGYLAHPWFNWGSGLALLEYELKPGISWLAVTPSVARYALSKSREFALRDNENPEQKSSIAFWHGSAHPVYEVWKGMLPQIRPTYAWYVRVPDLPGFLSHIAPVLEERIAQSHIPGYNGTLRINLYRTGVKLTFAQGRLTESVAYKPQPNDMGELGMPDLTVLQLVFGYRSLDELKSAYADCYWSSSETYYLVNTLFPKMPSSITGVA